MLSWECQKGLAVGQRRPEEVTFKQNLNNKKDQLFWDEGIECFQLRTPRSWGENGLKVLNQ